MARIFGILLLAAAAIAGERPKALEPKQAAEYQRLRAERMGAIASAAAREREARAAEDAWLAAQARLQAARQAQAEAFGAAEASDAALVKFEEELAGKSGCKLTPAAEWQCPEEGGAQEK